MNKFTRDLGFQHGINGKGHQPRTDINAPEYQRGYKAAGLAFTELDKGARETALQLEGFVFVRGRWTKKF